MKYYFVLIFFVVSFHNLSPMYLAFRSEHLQINIVSENVQDSITFTPCGPALKTNIHYIDKKHHLNIVDNHIQIIESKTGVISKEFTQSNSQKRVKSIELNSQKLTNEGNSTNTDFKDGWTTYAYCQNSEINPSPITSFSTKWVVPQPPANQIGQLIYIFNGLQTIENGIAYILQPVLQWGKSPAGGGDYWAVCNWFVTSNQFFYDSLIQVNPGTSLRGIIKLISKTDSSFNYSSSFANLTPEFKVNDSKELTTVYETLETYNLNDCNQYPSQEKITMSEINIKTTDEFPRVVWNAYNAEVGCGQFSKIVDGYSKNGQIDIYFHTPSTDDFFDVLHVFPNPVRDALSIISLKEIIDCKIEIFSFTGIKLQSIPSININYDYKNKSPLYYKLNMQKFIPGIYFVKVSYENKSHTFKIFKE